jgi:hypothetical protein
MTTQALKGTIISTQAPYNTREWHPVDQQPVYVALLLNEQMFRSLKGCMLHHHTVFFLDRMHDWEYDEERKAIRVYGSIDPDSPLDIVAVYKHRTIRNLECLKTK